MNKKDMKRFEVFKKRIKIHSGEYPDKEIKCDVCDCDSYTLIQLNSDKVCMYCMLDGLATVSIAENKFEDQNNLGWPFKS
jgi:hypothetical protein